MKSRKVTIFNTPLLSPLLRGLSIAGLRLWGWKVRGGPPGLRKYVLIGAPHTSNWDFLVMTAVVFSCRMKVYWMGKDSLFPWPFAGLVKWLGGIPIDRSRARRTVDQMVDEFAEAEDLVLLITPEGTRARVERWKAGFYHIACEARLPIQPAYVHGPGREVGFAPLFEPSGDYEADLPKIQEHYRGKQGIRPELSSGVTGK